MIELNSHSQIELNSHLQIELNSNSQIELNSHLQIELNSHSQIELNSHSQIELNSHSQNELNSHSQNELNSHLQIELSRCNLYVYNVYRGGYSFNSLFLNIQFLRFVFLKRCYFFKFHVRLCKRFTLTEYRCIRLKPK